MNCAVSSDINSHLLKNSHSTRKSLCNVIQQCLDIFHAKFHRVPLRIQCRVDVPNRENTEMRKLYFYVFEAGDVDVHLHFPSQSLSDSPKILQGHKQAHPLAAAASFSPAAWQGELFHGGTCFSVPRRAGCLLAALDLF